MSMLCCAVALSATPAAATTVQFNAFSNGFVLADVNPPSIVGATVDAGRYSGSPNGQSFFAFCIDLFHTLQFGPVYNDYASVAAGSYLGSSTKATDLGRLASGFLGSLNDTTTAAAFQLAIWEIVYESGSSYSLSGGTFTASGAGATAAVAQANIWLGNLPGTSTWQATVLDSSANQDVVSFAPVPLPAALGLLAAGLGLVGGAARRRRV